MQANAVSFLDLLNGQYQYIVPRWQRRYCWGPNDIERLVDDLLTVAARPEKDLVHYGGTVLTFGRFGPIQQVTQHRVIDGQQRLTTVSILLACIAEQLGPDGESNGWTARIIRETRLTNPGMPHHLTRKLRLQDRDEEEYRRGLTGKPEGSGAVTQAWKIARRLVRRCGDPGTLLDGIARLRVVHLTIDPGEDPQQIFESLNATGRPLTESEKVKNWLLIGLDEDLQRRIHEDCWLEIEKHLGAEHSSEPIDIFLRDFLRWKTGQSVGMNRTYEHFRRWAIRENREKDREALGEQLTHAAKLYGVLTDTVGEVPHQLDRSCKRELRHLRDLGLDTHRPFSLRLLNDAENGELGIGSLAKTLTMLGTWTTRMWLADRPLAGMNTAAAELAHSNGPEPGEDAVKHWQSRLHERQNSRVGVPDDHAVREGIRRRKAYGGKATQACSAVLYALIEAEQKDGFAPLNQLSVEHILPQKLTPAWKRELGENASELHGKWKHRLPNLTLVGAEFTNPNLGAKTFLQKRDAKHGYATSALGLTRRLCDFNTWNEEALLKRADDLASRALERWTWKPARLKAQPTQDGVIRWRFNGGDWRTADSAAAMVLAVAAALLERDPQNAQRLEGPTLTRDLFRASEYPAGQKVQSVTMRAVPGHKDWVIYPYTRDYPTTRTRCRRMAKRCGEDLEFRGSNEALTLNQRFWTELREVTGGLPGQHGGWRGPDQRTDVLNSHEDRLGVHVGGQEQVWFGVQAGGDDSEARRDRMLRISLRIRQEMSDQELGENDIPHSRKGWSISVLRSWDRSDEEQWPEVARWFAEQTERLRLILDEESA